VRSCVYRSEMTSAQFFSASQPHLGQVEIGMLDIPIYQLVCAWRCLH
jgi:hypothetical protein